MLCLLIAFGKVFYNFCLYMEGGASTCDPFFTKEVITIGV